MNYEEAKRELVKLLALIKDATATLEDARQKLTSIPDKYQADAVAALDKYRLEIEDERTRAVQEISKLRLEGLGELERIAKEKTIGFPWLAQAYEDYFSLRDYKLSSYLENKERPAPVAAETVRQLSKERREAEKAAKLSKSLLNYCKYLAPWLDEYVGLESDELDELIGNIHSSWQKKEKDFDDETRKHYGPKYDSLSESERLQRRLDWYWDKPNKPDWQLGRDYERYVGYLYEKDGWKVQYHGLKGFEDLGRDLVCKKGQTIQIIQCKRWAQGKEIHEKHMYYLFGTTVEYYIENTGTQNIQLDLFESNVFKDKVVPKMITTADVSAKAQQVADVLGIQVEKRAFNKYPSVKCNVSLVDGKKIFHLPFDQQYDTTKIDEEMFERFVGTVAEAEKLGFRHAYRWLGDHEGN